MAEETTNEAERPELPEWRKWLNDAAALLGDVMSIPRVHWTPIAGLLLITAWAAWWITAYAKDIKIEQVRLEGQRKLNDADERLRQSDRKLGDIERKNTELAQQVASLQRDRKALEETKAVYPPELQLTQAEFLHKVGVKKDSTEQRKFRDDCSNKTILNWTGTFAGTVEASATSKNRAVRVDFKSRGYTANCYLSNADRITGFAQTPIGTQVKITKGVIEEVNFLYMQMGKCEVVR
jgi:hypothetical protein